MTIAIYAMCGFFAAVAGIILCARNNSAQPGAAATYAFDSITAIVLGGVSIQGGRGKITGAIAGVVFWVEEMGWAAQWRAEGKKTPGKKRRRSIGR
jgi:ribose/xylose/arabinose/galactoside ABC-type transport system permease subunit